MANRDAFDRYRDSLSGTETLSPEAERALARRYRAGDTLAGERIVRASLPFVVAVALEYRRWGVALDDLVQQGNLGLLKAARRFDPSRDCRLVTYAVFWIRAEIRDYVVRAYRTVRIGTTKAERRALRAYRRTRDDDPSALAAQSGLPLDQVERLLPVLRSRDVSLDASRDGEGSAVERLSDGAPPADEVVDETRFRARARSAVHAAIARLPEREALIVRARLLRDDPVTLEALGHRLGISKERVRQLEERACRRLRQDLAELHDAA